MNSIGADNGADPSGGPLFARFFGALGGAEENDSESVFSGGDASELASTLPPLTNATTPSSEVSPNDSASVMADESFLPSSKSRVGGGSAVGGNGVVPPPEVDDGSYLFKFVAPGGTTHRFQARYDSFDFVTEIIGGKLVADPFFSSSPPSPTTANDDSTTTTTKTKVDPKDFQICYHDDDGDLISMTADQDVLDAVSVARKQGKDRVVIILRGGTSWEREIERRDSLAAARRTPVVVAPVPVLRVVEEEKEEEEIVSKKKRSTKEREADKLVMGFLNADQLLPASVALLAMAIVGVFTVSKITSKTS